MHRFLAILLLFGCGTAPASGDKITDDTADEASPDDSGSGHGGDDTASADCEVEVPVTWNGWAGGFFATYCRSCHSVSTPNRQGAPEGVDFDTQADVDRQIDAIWRTVLDQQRMPVGGGVYPDDLVLLEQYLCSRLD